MSPYSHCALQTIFADDASHDSCFRVWQPHLKDIANAYAPYVFATPQVLAVFANFETSQLFSVQITSRLIFHYRWHTLIKWHLLTSILLYQITSRIILSIQIDVLNVIGYNLLNSVRSKLQTLRNFS